MQPTYDTIIYLIHFDEPYRHAKHYMGSTHNLHSRLTDHAIGEGARLMEVIEQAGITWQLTRVWQGARKLERLLKSRKEAPNLCPVCAGEAAYGRARYPDLGKVTDAVQLLRLEHPSEVERVEDYYERRMSTPWLYWGDDEKRVGGEWYGQLAKEFGLQGEIDRERLYRLIEGREPNTGEQLIKDIGHEEYISRAGLVVTFSLPIQIATVADLSGNDELREGILRDHIESARIALEGMEKNHAYARIGDRREQSGNLIASIHHHGLGGPSGPLLLQVNTQAVIMNMTRGCDGRIHPLSENELLDGQAAATAVYLASLTDRLQRRGIEVALHPETGAPEVRRITQKYIEAVRPRGEDVHFRKRRKEAESLSEQWKGETASFDNNQGIGVSVENCRAVLKTDYANPQAGVFYTNSHGARFFQWLYEEAARETAREAGRSSEEVAEIRFGHSMMTANRDGVDIARQILDVNADNFLRNFGFTEEQIAGVKNIISTLDDALKQNVETFSFINVDHPRPFRELAEAHEIFHGWQLLLEAKTGRPHISEDWVRRQPGFDKVSGWLAAHHYPSGVQSTAREWAAFAATDDLRRMGLSRDETVTFLKNYFDQIVIEHGVDVLDKIGRVSRDARDIINDLKMQFAAERQKGARYEQHEGGAEGKTDTSPKFQKIDLGGELDNRAGADRRSAERGLAEWLGGAVFGGSGGAGGGAGRSGRVAYTGTETLIAALQSIANIEAPDPSGKRSLKELSGEAIGIARSAIAQAGGAEVIRDREAGAALAKIVDAGPSDQQGRLLSLQDRIDTAVKIARETIAEIQSRTLAGGAVENAAEMAQSRQPSTRSQGIGW